MKKGDIILIGGVLVLALLAFLLFFRKDAGSRVTVQVDGVVTAVFSQQEDVEYPIHTRDEGLNQLIIRDGQVWVEWANCPTQVCVQTGKISQAGELIVCLPHKVVVMIEE